MYSSYLQSLHFGSISDQINTVKTKELTKLTNPLDSKELGLQSKIDSLTSTLSAGDPTQAIESTISTVLNTAGGTVEGIAGTAKVIKAVKGKLTGKKDEDKDKENEEKEEPENEGEDNEADMDGGKSQPESETKEDMPDGDNPDEFAYSSNKPGEAQPNKAQRGEEDEPEGEDEEADMGDDVVDGPSELSEVTSTDLAPTTTEIPSTELGSGTVTNTEPAGSGEGDIEMTDFNAEMTPTDPNKGRSIEPQEDDAADDAGDAAGDAGADIAEGVVDVTAESSLEVAGAALDATGIGSIVGIFLGVAGAVMAGVSAGEGIADAMKKTDTESDIAGDEEEEDDLKQQTLDDQKAVAKQQFIGSSVLGSLSSTTLQNVTSGAF